MLRSQFAHEFPLMDDKSSLLPGSSFHSCNNALPLALFSLAPFFSLLVVGKNFADAATNRVLGL